MGFMPASAWKNQRVPLQLAPLCEQCGLYRHCDSPMMSVDGEGRRKILVLAEAPGEQEDFHGRPLVGPAGKEAARIFAAAGIDMRRDCWLTNAVICRPTKAGKNRPPLPKEIEFCRPNLVKTLKELRPNVIVPMGRWSVASLIPLAWKNQGADKIGPWVGWDIPSVKLNAWICPTYHPSYLMRGQNEESGERGKDPALELTMIRHLRRAGRHTKPPWRETPDYQARCKVVSGGDLSALEAMHRDAAEKGVPLAFDFETTTLKPDGPHAEILCVSVSDGRESHCWPWTRSVAGTLRAMIRDDRVGWIGANNQFEDRWCRRFLGSWVSNWKWDTMLGAHWRDCRHGICSLKFQAFVTLGVPDYSSHLDAYMESADGGANSPNRLREVEPAVLMRYCAMDSLLESWVAQVQMRGWYDG